MGGQETRRPRGLLQLNACEPRPPARRRPPSPPALCRETLRAVRGVRSGKCGAVQARVCVCVCVRLRCGAVHQKLPHCNC